MKKALIITVCGALLVPSIVDAAWWNVFSRKKSSVATSTATLATSSEPIYVPPSSDELLRRIAELEAKLEEAQANLKKLTGTVKPEQKKLEEVIERATAKTVTTVATESAPAPTASKTEVASRIRPSIVLIETATSSSSGVIIDSAGHILTSARVALKVDSSGTLVGVEETLPVTLSNGTKRDARLVGLDEAIDVAILQLSNKSSSSFIEPTYDSGVSVGDTLYIASAPSSRAKGGNTFVPATVTKKTSTSLEMSTTEKPIDMNGAVVTARGTLVGVQNPSSCRVLEDGKICLRYSVTLDFDIRGRMTKMLSGMRLFTNKQFATGEEQLIGGKFEGMYRAISEYGFIDSAYDYVSGKNSFDYFNDRLDEDDRGKITRIYLNKLKISADNIFKAYEWLKGQAYDLHVFFINNEIEISALSSYQRKIVSEIESFNTKRLADYTKEVDRWAKKKNEYDTRLADSSTTNHDYLLFEGALIETEAEKLIAEKKRVMKMFSGENIDIF